MSFVSVSVEGTLAQHSHCPSLALLELTTHLLEPYVLTSNSNTTRHREEALLHVYILAELAGQKVQLIFFPVRVILFPDHWFGGVSRCLSDVLTCVFSFFSNCLFRALGDQLEGHSRNHLRHRQETVDYMIKQREDFEPFVEDDVPFEKHGMVSPPTGCWCQRSLWNVITTHLSTLLNRSSSQSCV